MRERWDGCRRCGGRNLTFSIFGRHTFHSLCKTSVSLLITLHIISSNPNHTFQLLHPHNHGLTTPLLARNLPPLPSSQPPPRRQQPPQASIPPPHKHPNPRLETKKTRIRRLGRILRPPSPPNLLPPPRSPRRLLRSPQSQRGERLHRHHGRWRAQRHYRGFRQGWQRKER